MFERAKTVHALDRAATGSAFICTENQRIRVTRLIVVIWNRTCNACNQIRRFLHENKSRCSARGFASQLALKVASNGMQAVACFLRR
jgi:hypothetical protein